MVAKVTRWGKIKSAVSNIDTLLKVGKWLLFLIGAGAASAATVLQYDINQRQESRLTAMEQTNPEYVTVKEINPIEKPTFTRQIVKDCQCPSISECQNIVTQAIEKNNRKHHPGFK